MKRVNVSAKKAGGDYFPARSVKFISSGCTTLDCVLGGGWAVGRISNIVGDKSVGKTLLAIEACANFAVKYPKGRIWYREGEAAFDEDYARRLGLPVDQVDFGPEGIDSVWDTVEKVFVDLERQLDRAKKDKIPAGLYIIDSLDALSSEAEMERDIGKGSFGLEKQKRLGELFRRLVRKIRDSNVHLMFISQIRDKIGVVFGDKHTRTGGKALDFYASQILWLYNAGTRSATIRGVKRAVAVAVKAKCKKNKISEPNRECAFEIKYGYGVDDLLANLEWLEEVKKLSAVTSKTVDRFIAEIEALDDKHYTERIKAVSNKVISLWLDVEEGFRPKRAKYRAV